MSHFESDTPFDNEGDDREDLAWNEFDWERYLRAQDEVVQRYVAFYEQLRDHPERLDEVARFMGWDAEVWSTELVDLSTLEDDEEDEGSSDFDDDPYTLHKNPVFIATRAIQLTLKRSWESIAHDSRKVPQGIALGFQTALHRAEENALLAIQSLDFGDYALAVSLFKRALRDLNQTLSYLDDKQVAEHRALAAFRTDAFPRLFDLREIWLRVMQECRQELARPTDNSDEEER